MTNSLKNSALTASIHTRRVTHYEKKAKIARNLAIAGIVLAAIAGAGAAAFHFHSFGLEHAIQNSVMYAFGGAAGLFVLGTILAILGNRDAKYKIVSVNRDNALLKTEGRTQENVNKAIKNLSQEEFITFLKHFKGQSSLEGYELEFKALASDLKRLVDNLLYLEEEVVTAIFKTCEYEKEGFESKLDWRANIINLSKVETKEKLSLEIKKYFGGSKLTKQDFEQVAMVQLINIMENVNNREHQSFKPFIEKWKSFNSQ